MTKVPLNGLFLSLIVALCVLCGVTSLCCLLSFLIFIGSIFTDVARIHLQSHLPIIVDFWHDSLFGSKLYQRNTLLKHLEIHEKMPLRAGHFTRWLYLFNQAVTARHHGSYAKQMLESADRIAKTITD